MTKTRILHTTNMFVQFSFSVDKRAVSTFLKSSQTSWRFQQETRCGNVDIFRSVSKLRFRAYEAFSNNQIQQTQLIIDDMNLLSNFKLNETPAVFSPRSHPAKAYATTWSGLLSWVSLVLLFQDFEEVLGHHVGPLRAAVIPLQILHWKEVKEKDIKPAWVLLRNWHKFKWASDFAMYIHR